VGEGDGQQSGQGRRMKIVSLRQQQKPEPEESGSTDF